MSKGDGPDGFKDGSRTWRGVFSNLSNIWFLFKLRFIVIDIGNIDFDCRRINNIIPIKIFSVNLNSKLFPKSSENQIELMPPINQEPTLRLILASPVSGLTNASLSIVPFNQTAPSSEFTSKNWFSSISNFEFFRSPDFSIFSRPMTNG